MIERRPMLDLLAHLILILGLAVVAFPLYIAIVASTQTAQEVANAPMSLWPGSHATSCSSPSNPWLES